MRLAPFASNRFMTDAGVILKSLRNQHLRRFSCKTAQISIHRSILDKRNTMKNESLLSRYIFFNKINLLPQNKAYSRVTFKAQLKVGWQPKYYIECYMSKCWSYPEVYESARNFWPLLVRAEKSKMASKMAARNKCKGVLYMICCTDLMYFNTSN